MKKKLLSCLFFLVCSMQPVNAALVRVSYSATIGFDPSGALGAGGLVTEDLVNELFGPGVGSTGTALLTGSFTYETNTPALNSNNRGAGYTNAITATTATLNVSRVDANIAEIALNAATSEYGYNTNPSAGFCASLTGCNSIGEPFTPTGNVVQVINNSNFFVLANDGTRTNFSNRDAIGLFVGRTDSENEFSPKLATPSFGDVFVDGVGLFFISNASRSLINSVAMPTSDSFVTSTEVETTIFTLHLSGENIPDNFSLVGRLDDFTTVVPVPAAVWFMGTGLLGLMGITRSKKAKISC